MKDKKTQAFYDFAGFRLDPQKKRLLYSDTLVSLTPKEFEVLLLLVENAGRVVEKDELLEKIWHDTFVEEGTLTRNVSWLRKKLAAHTDKDSKIIETIPKIGYRLLREVVRQEITLEENPSQPEVAEENAFPKSFADNQISAQKDEADFVSNTLPTITPVKPRFSNLWLISAILLILLGGFVVYQAYFSKESPRVVLASKIVPFSGLPGRERFPAFSPDGKQLVYSWDGNTEGGNSDIYIKLIGTGEPVRLTNTSAEEINPVFSPDGSSIFFVRILPTHNEIVSIPALGGAERIIYDHASYASISFSPDGKYLAHANLDLSQNEAGIILIDLQNGEKTRLTTPAAPTVDHTPRFSPDGKALAFIRYFSSFRREIFVIPAAGGEPHQITADDTRIYGLAWGSDSRKLLFTSYRSINQLNLWQTSVNGGKPQLIPTNSKGLDSLSISPNGRTIAFVEENADENIWEIEPGNAPRPLIRSISADHSQQFSPDGKQIVFTSDRTGNYEIWLADADGKNQRQLTNSKGSAGSPRFSPDGKFIAYDAQTSGKSDIFIIPTNGGEPRRLTNDDKNSFLPAWSLEGQTIFFISNRSGSEQIWKIPASGGEATQVTIQGAFEVFAAPDGKNLIYSKGSGKTGLWQVNVNGTDEKPISELSEAGGWRSWTVATSGIYYTAPNTQPPYQIKFFDLSNRQTKNITNIDRPPLMYYSNLNVSADGKRILYSRQDQSADTIFLAEFEEGK